MVVRELAITLGISVVNKIIELAILKNAETGKVPTYEELEEANLLTDLKIDKMMNEPA
jgi:hypothetical protein